MIRNDSLRWKYFILWRYYYGAEILILSMYFKTLEATKIAKHVKYFPKLEHMVNLIKNDEKQQNNNM